MKRLTKSLMVAGVVSSISMGGIGTALVANAATTTATTSPDSSLIDKIASTFGIDKSKLQQLFEQDHEAKDAQRKQEIETKLQALVAAGTITSAQKTAIDTELTKLDQERQADTTDMSSLTDAQRKAKMDAQRTELETWAKAQGIDLTKLQGIFGGPGGPAPAQ